MSQGLGAAGRAGDPMLSDGQRGHVLSRERVSKADVDGLRLAPARVREGAPFPPFHPPGLVCNPRPDLRH